MEVNNYKFKFIENGDGEPVVFVHGSLSDYRIWEDQMDKFSENFRTIAYSRRFHWPNEKIAEDEDYSMHQHVSDLQEILNNIGEPVHLVGHSYGGFICLLLAMKSDDLIRSMTLAEPPIFTLYLSDPPKTGEVFKLLFTKPKTALPLIKFGATAIEPTKKLIRQDKTDKAIETFGKAALGEEAYTNFSDEVMERIRENFIDAEFIGSGFPPINIEEVQKIGVPTLLLSAEDSPKFFQHLSDGLEKNLPNAKLTQITDASHIMQQENPDEFYENVLSFIENQSE